MVFGGMIDESCVNAGGDERWIESLIIVIISAKLPL
jgi:hypothetical protein